MADAMAVLNRVRVLDDVRLHLDRRRRESQPFRDAP
jgi:hypothetical protein